MHVRSQAAPHAPGQAGGLVKRGKVDGRMAQRGDRVREREGDGKADSSASQPESQPRTP